jgi:hypothetical protein
MSFIGSPVIGRGYFAAGRAGGAFGGGVGDANLRFVIGRVQFPSGTYKDHPFAGRRESEPVAKTTGKEMRSS